MSAIKSFRKVKFYLKPIALAMACCFALNAQANPIGASVVNGQASFATIGNTLNITNSPNAIINWQGFSINAGETTRFIQQSASSSVLNRVLGADPSLLLGTLTSNGRVFLINPAGILVGQGARIDVPGFVASTLNITDSNFLANKLSFDATPNAGAIQNNGTITTTEGGAVYLVAPQIENNGIITTPKGETILAAGNTVQLVDTGTPGVLVEVTGSDNSATNLGQILADSGRVGMVAATIKNSGTISTNSLVSQGGRVFLKASNRVEAGGTITASGTTGGKIEVLGNQVGVMDGATVNANGSQGGGTVLIGGDYQGKNPAVQNAQVTYLAPTATLSADATDTGNGGKVIVWADDTTRAYGNISARGGNNGGDGGLVEISGKRYLETSAAVDTRAPQGKAGTLLLDPTSITIDATSSAPSSGSFTGNTPNDFAGGANASSTMGWGYINGLLTANNVIIQTSSAGGGAGNITFSGAGVSAGGIYSLSFLAENNITVNAPIAYNSSGNLIMVSGWNSATGYVTPTANGAGLGDMSIAANISSTSSGQIKLMAKRHLSITDAMVTTASGNMYVEVGDNLTLTAVNNFTSLKSGGTQTINFTGAGAHLMTLLGSTTAGAGSASANVESNGLQTIDGTTGGGTLGITLTGGNAIAASPSDAYAYLNGVQTANLICSSCATWDGAHIRSNGGQTINASAITITGGSGGNGNWAGIENKSTSVTQSITTTGAITVTGGIGAGVYNATYNDSITNEASIHSDGTQTISAGSINVLGGGDAATLGGAFLTGKLGQDITTTGNMVVTGGASSAAGQYGLGAPAIIGEQFAANLALHIGGNLTMTGGAGTTSQALIGAAQGTPNIDITAGAGIFMLDGGSSSRIGVLTGGPAGALSMTATTLDITQGTSSYINTGNLSAHATVGNINLAGPNLVNTVVDLSASGTIGYVSAQSVHIGSVISTAAAAAGDVTIISTLGGDISLGTLDATGIATVTADGAIYDDNYNLTNITAPTIHLTSNNGGAFGGLAISADTQVAAGGAITADVAAGSYGGIRINNIATNSLAAGAPATVSLSDLSVNGGMVTFTHVGDVDSANTTLISATTNHGNIFIGVDGTLIERGASITVDTPDIAWIGASWDMSILGSITNLSGSLGLGAGLKGTVWDMVGNFSNTNAALGLGLTPGSSLQILGGSVSALNDLGLAASNITITDGSAHAGGNVFVYAAEDIRINATFGNTASITADYDVFLALGGPASTLYFNDPIGTYDGTAQIESNSAGGGLAQTIYLDFLGRSSGGVMIDGVETLTTAGIGSTTASGFYDFGSPAVYGTNLFVSYYQLPTDFVVDYVDKILPPPITVDEIGPPPPDTFVVVVAPPPGGDSGGMKSFDSSSGGIGSSEPGAFGASEPAAPAAGGEAGKSDQGSGSNGDAKKDGDKKEDAKEDKKDKKDDTASKEEKDGKDDKDKGKKDEKPGKC